MPNIDKRTQYSPAITAQKLLLYVTTTSLLCTHSLHNSQTQILRQKS